METCPECNGTGLVQGQRRGLENGRWTYITTKYRKTCPTCRGTREVAVE
jgi:DnaJ-class molecular chaperone